MKTDFGNRTHTYIAVGKDKSPFRQLSNLCIRNMNGAETNKDKAIIVDEVVSGSSGPVVPTPTSASRTSPVPPISIQEQQRAMKSQERMLAHYKENMDKKTVAKQVSPENKKKCAAEEEEQAVDAKKHGVETVTTIVETKTVRRDDNGNPTTIVTTTKSTSYGPPPPPPI